MRAVTAGAIMIVVIGVTAAGCGREASSSASPSSAPVAEASTTTWPDPGQFTPAPTGVVDDDTGETLSPDPAVWDDQSRAAAIRAAETAMDAFARPDLDHAAWWAGLEPLLTREAATVYVDVDPANIPVHGLTGPGVIVDDTSAYVATVQIPTAAGRYNILISRRGGSAPWLVEKIRPLDQ